MVTGVFVWLKEASQSVKKSLFGKIIEIKLPGRVNIDSDPNWFFDQFRTFFETPTTEISEVIIDLTEAEFIYPSAIIFLLSLRENFKDDQFDLKFSIINGSPVHEYLLFAGVDQYVKIPPFPENTAKVIQPASRVFKLRSGNELGDTYALAITVVDMLKEQQNLSLMVEATTIDSVEEILRNIKQHSEFSNFLLLGQYYPISNRIRFSLYDDGIGIKAHVTRRDYAQTHPAFRDQVSPETFDRMRSESANLAIEQAARKMVSGSDYVNNSGAGLDFLISDLSVPTDGTVSILSEDGFVLWVKGKITKSVALPFKVVGTTVSWTINCTPGTILQYSSE
jgi:hypothetical protein